MSGCKEEQRYGIVAGKASEIKMFLAFLKKWDSQRHWSKGENKFYNAGEENAGALFLSNGMYVCGGVTGGTRLWKRWNHPLQQKRKKICRGQKQVGDRTFASILWWVSNPYVQSLSLPWPKTHCLGHLTSTNTGFPTSTSASSCPKPRSTPFLLIHAFYCITTCPWWGEEESGFWVVWRPQKQAIPELKLEDQ